MNHTQSEWIATRGSHSYPLEITTATKTIAQIECRRTIEETEANARLIAAAPDLLDACNELAGIFPEFSMSELDAADFKDRAHRIWAAAQTAKIAITKTQQADEPEKME